MDNIFTKKETIILGVVGFVQFVAASIFTATISKDSSSFLLGFSKARLALLGVMIFLALLCLACSYLSFFHWDKVKAFITRNEKKIFYTCISLFIGTFIFFILVFNSPVILGKNYDAYFERLFPLAASSFLLMVEGVGFHLIKKSRQIDPQQSRNFLLCQNKPVGILTLILFAMLLVSYLSKFGLLLETRYWNVPGIPVGPQQFMLVFILFTILYFLHLKSPRIGKLLLDKKVIFLLAIIVYFAAVIIWGNTPLERHFFSLVPAAPDFQPYPHSDARLHDLGALSVLMGKGIFFHHYTDKPMLMVIFTVAHLFAGNDYLLLQNVLVAFLAVIPVIIFLTGVKFHHPVFGLFIAFITIIQQKNAILLSTIVASVNVKLEVTETFTLLGIGFLVLVLFLWSKTKSEKYIFLAGVIVAAISLIRMNPLFYMPAICLLILIVFWKAWKIFLKQLLLLCIGFLLVFSPWLITGTDPEGVPWAMVKIIDVINNRVAPTLEEHLTISEQESPMEAFVFENEEKIPQILQSIEQLEILEVERMSLFPVNSLPFAGDITEEAGLETTYLYLFANHFIHNIDTLFLSLPDGMLTQDIHSIAQREYLHDGNNWNGVLPGKQILLILINFSLFSMGLYYGWKKHSWSGLMPAFCMITYVLSISIALTSGGRYIVPINWILYFYYLFGIVFLFDWFTALIKSERMSFSKAPETRIDFGKWSWPSIIILVAIFSSMIPIANKVLPLVISRPTISQQAYEPDHAYLEGILFYPYIMNDVLSFEIIEGANMRSVKVLQNDIKDPSIRLVHEESVLFSVNPNNEITELILVRDNEFVKYIEVIN